jgi:single-stranded DNA-specific DHH superfamily exonuclease
MEKVQVIHTFQKNKEEEVRFSIREYKERQYFDVRVWFLSGEGGEYHPTKKGITLSLELLPELRKGIERVSRQASELALPRRANSVE